jgi:hypothetical protein
MSIEVKQPKASNAQKRHKWVDDAPDPFATKKDVQHFEKLYEQEKKKLERKKVN